jgi:hypothetical protein
MPPEVGSSRPRSIERVVVLPAPLPPKRADIVPPSNPKDRSSTAKTEENFLVRFSVCKIMFKRTGEKRHKRGGSRRIDIKS